MPHKIHTIQLLLILLVAFRASADSLNCLNTYGSSYYDLTPLSSTADYVIPNIDGNNQVYMEFNVCRFMTKQCHGKFAFASLFSNNSGVTDCIDISDTTKFNFITTTILDSTHPSSGLRMLFEDGDSINNTISGWSPLDPTTIANNPQGTYSVQFNFICNNSANTPWISGFNFIPNNFTYTIDFHTTSGCALLTFDQVSQFIGDHPIPFTVVGSVMGFLIMILGLKLFLPTIALFGFGAGFLVTFFTFFSSIVTPDSRESTKWILLGFSIVFGLCLGYIVVIVNKLGVFLMGAWFGFIISLILYNAVLYKIKSNPASLVLLLSCGIGALVFGILALIFYKHVVIISTSLVGSYLLVRSISLVIGGFPNEIKLVNEIQTQDYAFTVSWTFYVYMNVILALTIIAIIIQYKIKKRSERKADEFEDDPEFQKLDI